MTPTISWFEVPALDLDRAVTFYSHVLGHQLEIQDFGGMKMANFSPDPEAEVSGALIVYDSYTPSATHGPLIYLNAGEDLQPLLDRVEPAGGKVTIPKTQISPEMGYYAVFVDSEGNRMAFHSQN